MAKRDVVQQQRLKVEDQLRAALGQGVIAPGQRFPSVREIAQQFDVTTYVAHQILKGLTAEGLVQGTRSRGTFTGRDGRPASEHYLFLGDAEAPVTSAGEQMCNGFEDRIAQLGGAVLTLDWQSVLNTPPEATTTIAGVFYLSGRLHPELFAPKGPLSSEVPMVRFKTWETQSSAQTYDTIAFDDQGGGIYATEYLLKRGYRSIAFLGVHSPHCESIFLNWSFEREAGWRSVMQREGMLWQDMVFGPEHDPPDDSIETLVQASYRAALPLSRRADIGAVVTANDSAALGLRRALIENGKAPGKWPAIISFDNSAAAQKHSITSLRLPWDEAGRRAANLIWQRRRGEIRGAPQHHKIAMRLIPRLTCQTQRASKEELYAAKQVVRFCSW